MRKERFIFVLFFLVQSMFSFAQEDSIITIKGRVLEYENQKPLEFATVCLISKLDSTIFCGTITDKNGQFIFNQIKSGNYLLRASFFGFESKLINIQKNNNSLLINLEDIFLNPKFQQLKEVTITAKKTAYQSFLNKEIFSPDSATLSNATNGLDVLTKAPYVVVNKAFNSISVVGKKNVLLLVNGVKRDEKDIKMLLPEEIEKVEVITAASSKYDSEVDAVINIILKKEIKHGLIISPEIDYSGKAHNESSVNIQYGLKKMRFFMDYNFYYRKHNISSKAERVSFSGINKYKYNSELESLKPLEFGHTVGYGCDYFLNEKNVLNLSGRFDIINIDKTYLNKATNFVNDSLLDSYSFKKYNNGLYKMTNYSLFYKRKFNNESQLLTTDINFYNLSSHSKIENNDFYDSINHENLPLDIIQENDMIKQSANLQVDYSHPLSDSLILETGYNLYCMWHKNDFVNNTNEKNVLRYNDFRNSLFFQLIYTAKKFSIQSGIRFEQTNDIINDTSSSYHHFLPFASIMYNFKSNKAIRLNYSTKLNRPDIWSLNPFLYQEDSLNYYSGNAYLKPSVNHSISVNYSYRKNDFFVSTEGYMKIATGVIAKEIRVENNIKYQTLKNIGLSNIYGVKAFVSQKFLKRIQLSLSVNGYYVEVSDKNYANNGMSYSSFLSSEISLPKQISMFFSFQIPEKSYYLQGYSQENISLVYVGVGKSIFHEKGYLKLISIYPFSKIETKTYENFDNYSLTENTNINFTMIRIVFSYYLDKGLKINSLDRTDYMEKDR